MFANADVETMDRVEMARLQQKRLIKVIEWVYEKSLFYNKQMTEQGIIPADIQDLADIEKLPFTTSADLANSFPYGMLTFPLSAVSRLHVAESRNGRQIANAYTSSDIGKWMEMLSRTMVAGGMHTAEVLYNSLGYGQEPEGLGVHYAAELAGVVVLPAGSGEPAEQLQQMLQFGVTAVAASPNRLLEWQRIALAYDIPLQELPIHTIFVLTDHLDISLASFAEAYNAKVIGLFSCNEIMGPGIAGGCSANSGFHIQEDYFYPEIIDPQSGRVLAEGETGELVLTSLAKEAMPVLRYRTGCRAALDSLPCACGRTLTRLLAK